MSAAFLFRSIRRFHYVAVQFYCIGVRDTFETNSAVTAVLTGVK
jgi:hypothetical protein